MRRVAVLLGLLTTSALAESRHLPPGLNAVRVLDGEARLILPGTDKPDVYPTLLPEGVFFTSAGYESLEAATLKLQDDLRTVTVRLAEANAACPAVEMPRPPPYEVRGWKTKHLVIVGGVLLVVGGAVGFIAANGR